MEPFTNLWAEHLLNRRDLIYKVLADFTLFATKTLFFFELTARSRADLFNKNMTISTVQEEPLQNHFFFFLFEFQRRLFLPQLLHCQTCTKNWEINLQVNNILHKQNFNIGEIAPVIYCRFLGVLSYRSSNTHIHSINQQCSLFLCNLQMTRMSQEVQLSNSSKLTIPHCIPIEILIDLCPLFLPVQHVKTSSINVFCSATKAHEQVITRVWLFDCSV